MTYRNVQAPPANHSERLPIYRALVREIYADMTRRNPDSIPSIRHSAAKGQAWKHLQKAGW
jgi:hypothetical protein